MARWVTDRIVAVVSVQWDGSDAWVFSSIVGGGCSLAQIVMNADYINHAILTEAEFVRAVPRLLAAGLIGADPDADRYWHTEAGRKLYQSRMKKCGLFGWIEAIPPALARLGEPQDSVWALPEGVFDRAVRAYLKR